MEELTDRELLDAIESAFKAVAERFRARPEAAERAQTELPPDEHFNGFIEAQVSAGRYSSASDVVRAGLRLLEEQEVRLAALRSALVEGEGSGVSSRDAHDIWAAVKERRP